MSEHRLSQIEYEVETHNLSMTKRLSDGSYGKIFSRNPRNAFGIFTYNCHLCSVENLPDEVALRTHINDKKHQMKTSYDYIPDANQFRAPLAIYPKNEPSTSSEVVDEPLGHEDDAFISCILEPTYKTFDKALIGVEYVLELYDQKTKEMRYICTLCNGKYERDPIHFMFHLQSDHHRLKYLDTHFPSLMSVLNRDKKFFNVNNVSYREEVLTKIAKTLQDKFGIGKPSKFEYREYERNKDQITEKMKNLKHFNEKDFPGSEKILLEGIEIGNVIQHNSSSDSSDSESYDTFEKKQARKSVDSSKFKNAVPQERLPNVVPSTSMQPSQISIESEQYKTSIEIEICQIELCYKDFEKNPERHPNYSDEWKTFWQRRYTELIAQGKDANGHNYKSEWVEFWMPRMRQIKLKEIEDKKKEIRKKLNITLNVTNDENTATNSMQSSSPSTHNLPRDSRLTVASSYEKRKMHHNDRESFANYGRNFEDQPSSQGLKNSDDDHIDVKEALRFVAAHASDLGAAGVQFTKLLEKYLEKEENSSYSSKVFLLEPAHLNLLVDAKNKLNDLLSENLIGSKRNTITDAIQKIDALINAAEKIKKMLVPQHQSLPDQSIPTTSINNIQTDKMVNQQISLPESEQSKHGQTLIVEQNARELLHRDE